MPERIPCLAIAAACDEVWPPELHRRHGILRLSLGDVGQKVPAVWWEYCMYCVARHQWTKWKSTHWNNNFFDNSIEPSFFTTDLTTKTIQTMWDIHSSCSWSSPISTPFARSKSRTWKAAAKDFIKDLGLRKKILRIKNPIHSRFGTGF